jgi:hypothetical protein
MALPLLPDKRAIVKNHIDSSTALLAQMFQEAGRSGDGLTRWLHCLATVSHYRLPM